MTAQIINGKAIAAKLIEKMAKQIQTNLAQGFKKPGLAVILVGDDPASTIYVKNKRIACEQIGISSIYHHLPEHVSAENLMLLIKDLNNDSTIDGILLQLPLPKQINTDVIIESIHPAKDVDGFHPYNFGRLAQRRPLLRPCTPYGVMLLLEHIKVSPKGKHAVVIGASNIVGRPMAFELLMAGATVTICHRLTSNLNTFIKQADILVSAVGKSGFIGGDDIKQGSVVIDIGITRLADGSITGDVNFKEAMQRASWITPVPGGVGPMTVAVLLYNTLLAADYNRDKFKSMTS